jgi:hypothetical protein
VIFAIVTPLVCLRTTPRFSVLAAKLPIPRDWFEASFSLILPAFCGGLDGDRPPTPAVFGDQQNVDKLG